MAVIHFCPQASKLGKVSYGKRIMPQKGNPSIVCTRVCKHWAKSSKNMVMELAIQEHKNWLICSNACTTKNFFIPMLNTILIQPINYFPCISYRGALKVKVHYNFFLGDKSHVSIIGTLSVTTNHLVGWNIYFEATFIFLLFLSTQLNSHIL